MENQSSTRSLSSICDCEFYGKFKNTMEAHTQLPHHKTMKCLKPLYMDFPGKGRICGMTCIVVVIAVVLIVINAYIPQGGKAMLGVEWPAETGLPETLSGGLGQQLASAPSPSTFQKDSWHSRSGLLMLWLNKPTSESHWPGVNAPHRHRLNAQP